MTEAAPDPSTIRRSGDPGRSRWSCPTTSSREAGRILTASGADAPTGPPARGLSSPGTSNRPSDTVQEYHGKQTYDRLVTTKPVNLAEALESFDAVYSPRIVASINDYDVRIAHAKGDHLWHVHEDTDEFFLVLDGEFHVAVRNDDGGESTVVLRKGDTYVVPKGIEHKPSSPGASILMFEPRGTSTTGDRHEGEIPDHIDSTIGDALG
jgi:mannose-6-phosphate isomerase-like protein (cupin superfamily)